MEFVFGIDAMPSLVEIAENLDKSARKPMRRRRTLSKPPGKPRAKRPREKEAVVVRNEYLNKKLAGERIAEFDYRPGKCDRTYRFVVLHEEVHLKRGQMRLFDKEQPVYFFSITNAAKSSKSTRQVVVGANARRNQENNIAQLKQCALPAPLNDLTSNWAYMVIASLAWNLKIWSGLMITPSGTAKQREEQAAIKNKLIAYGLHNVPRPRPDGSGADHQAKPNASESVAKLSTFGGVVAADRPRRTSPTAVLTLRTQRSQCLDALIPPRRPTQERAQNDANYANQLTPLAKLAGGPLRGNKHPTPNWGTLV